MATSKIPAHIVEKWNNARSEEDYTSLFDEISQDHSIPCTFDATFAHVDVSDKTLESLRVEYDDIQMRFDETKNADEYGSLLTQSIDNIAAVIKIIARSMGFEKICDLPEAKLVPGA